MKKPLRFVLIGVASLLLLLALVVALALTPGVQTWAARKFAPASSALTVGVGSVNAGLKRTRVENVRVVQPGLVLTIPSAEVEVSIIDAAGGKIEVKRLVAKGWTLDLTAPLVVSAGAPTSADESKSVASAKPSAPASAQAKPEDAARTAFNGLFKLIQLPFDLAVDGVDLSGAVILPQGRGMVSITGGGIAAGKDGKFALAADLKSADASAVNVRGDLSARMATARTFDRFGLSATASVQAPGVGKGAVLALSLIAADAPKGEAYSVAIRSGEHEIATVDIALPPGTAPLVGSWKLDLGHADIAPFLAGRPLPEFTTKGQGTFSADRAFGHIQAVGAFDGAMDKLAAIQPELATLGRLTFNAGFDVATQGEIVRLNKLEGRIAGDRPVASLVSLQAIEITPSTRAIKAADPTTDLVRLTLDGLPLAWTKPFLGDLAITGADVRGGFTVSARDGGLVVRPSTPITLSNLSVSKAGKPLVSGLDFSLSAQADYSPKGFSAEVTNFTVLSASAPLFKLTAKAAQPAGVNQPLTVTGAFESDLAVAASQPVAAGAIALKRGVARGEFTAGVSTAKTATFTLQLADLVAADAVSSPLPSVAMQARADIDAAGRINVQLPVVVTQGGRRSDVTLGAVVTPTKTGTQISARVTSDTLNLPDLMLFSALSPSAPTQDATTSPTPNPPPVAATPTPASPPPAAKPPVAPLWAGITGELQIALKKVVYSPQVQVADIGGAIKITPTALTWDNLHATLTTGGSFKADGGLQFDAKQAQPYGLKTDVALTNVEPAPILRALSPGKPAPIDGKFDLTTQLSGRASDPAKFGESVIGDIHLIGNGGTIQALSMRDAAVVDGVSKAAALVGLFGQLTGKGPNKDVEKVRAVAEVTSQLAKIPFEKLNVLAGRDEKNNFTIKDLTLHSSLLHLAGTGQVTYQPGVPFLRQPLSLTLKLGARDQLADNLRTLKLIDGQPDKDGYSALVEDVKLDGSLQSIGTGQLSAMLKRALTN